MSQSGGEPIRVLLVDDHAVVRKGLRALLDRESSIEVIDEAEVGEGAVRAADSFHPDVMLMVLEVPGIGGLGATRRIADMHPETRVVVLTRPASEEIVLPSLKGV